MKLSKSEMFKVWGKVALVRSYLVAIQNLYGVGSADYCKTLAYCKRYTEALNVTPTSIKKFIALHFPLYLARVLKVSVTIFLYYVRF